MRLSGMPGRPIERADPRERFVWGSPPRSKEAHMTTKTQGAAQRTAAAVAAAFGTMSRAVGNNSRTSLAERAASLPGAAVEHSARVARKVPEGVKKVAAVLPESAPLVGKVAKKRRGPKLLKRLGLATAAIAATADIVRRVRARDAASGAGSRSSGSGGASRASSNGGPSTRSSSSRSSGSSGSSSSRSSGGSGSNAKRSTAKRSSSGSTKRSTAKRASSGSSKRSPAKRSSSGSSKSSTPKRSSSSSKRTASTGPQASSSKTG